MPASSAVLGRAQAVLPVTSAVPLRSEAVLSVTSAVLGRLETLLSGASTVAGVVEAVLSAASQPTNSVFFITDGSTSTSTVFTIIERLQIPGGFGVFTTTLNSSDLEIYLSRVIPAVKLLRQRSSYPTVVVISDDLAFLATFVKWSLKGRLLVWSTRLLVVTRLSLHHLHHHYTAFSKMNAMLLIIHDDDDIASIRCNVYVQLPFSPRGTQPLWVASWTPQRGLALTSSLPLFPDKFSRFNTGFNLLAASEGNPFHKMVVTDDPEAPGGQRVQFKGPMGELMDFIATAMNVSYTNVRPPDRYWGNRLQNGSWSGMVGMVMRQEVDLAVGPVMLLGERTGVVDFTVPAIIDYWKIMGARGRPEVDPWGFLFPLEPLVWAVILGALLVLPASLFLMSSCFFQKTSGQRNWLLLTFDYIRILLQQDKNIRENANWWWERMMLAVWGLVTVVLTQSYAGNLMALLAVRHISEPYQSRRDVLDDPSTTMIWLKGSGLEDFLQSQESGIYYKMNEAMKTGHLIWRPREEFPEAINTLVRRGDHVLIDAGYTLISHFAQDFTKNGKCSFYSSREGFLPLILGMISSMDNPIVPAINKRITAATEAGLFFKWLMDSEPNSTICLNAPTSITVRASLSISNLWGMFVILTVGHGAGFLILCLEIITVMIQK
nr:probable glutamate receptor [Procambarus clarkii]